MNYIAVLIAEDDPDSLMLLKIELEMKGYKVFTAIDGEEALQKLNQIRPNLILTDLNMPKVSGLELIQYVKSNVALSETPVVAVSAYEDALSEAAKQGVSKTIRKPLDLYQLEEAISEYLPPIPNSVRRNQPAQSTTPDPESTDDSNQ